jgi:hypothetical protein
MVNMAEDVASPPHQIFTLRLIEIGPIFLIDSNSKFLREERVIGSLD